MRTLLIALALLLAPAAALAGGTVGQAVIYRHNSTHYYPGILAHDNGDGSWSVICFDTDSYSVGFPFGTNSQQYYATIQIDAFQDETDSTDNRWRINTAVSRVTGTGTPSLALNGSAVQLDADHDTEYVLSVKITTAITISGGAAGHVDLVCDSSATPSAIVETVSGELTGTVVVGVSVTRSTTEVMRYRVPAGHYCKLTTTNDTGTPTYSIVRQVSQTMGV